MPLRGRYVRCQIITGGVVIIISSALKSPHCNCGSSSEYCHSRRHTYAGVQTKGYWAFTPAAAAPPSEQAPGAAWQAAVLGAYFQFFVIGTARPYASSARASASQVHSDCGISAGLAPFRRRCQSQQHCDRDQDREACPMAPSRNGRLRVWKLPFKYPRWCGNAW